MVNWRPEIALKDVVQIGVLVVGLTLGLGRLEAATRINAQTLEELQKTTADTLEALQKSQSKHNGRINKLELARADLAGYERAKRELVKNQETGE